MCADYIGWLDNSGCLALYLSVRCETRAVDGRLAAGESREVAGGELSARPARCGQARPWAGSSAVPVTDLLLDQEAGSTPAVSPWTTLLRARLVNDAPMRRISGHRGRPPLAPCCRPRLRTSPCTCIPATVRRQVAAMCHSERCCGIPASRARTSVSRYRRWPPSVRIDVSLPALAHRVTVFGSTRNIVATSAGVSSGSASGVRADIITASPPGPVLRSCVCAVLAPPGTCRGCPIWSTQTILPSPAVTSRPPGAKFLLRVAPLLH